MRTARRRCDPPITLRQAASSRARPALRASAPYPSASGFRALRQTGRPRAVLGLEALVRRHDGAALRRRLLDGCSRGGRRLTLGRRRCGRLRRSARSSRAQASDVSAHENEPEARRATPPRSRWRPQRGVTRPSIDAGAALEVGVDDQVIDGLIFFEMQRDRASVGSGRSKGAGGSTKGSTNDGWARVGGSSSS